MLSDLSDSYPFVHVFVVYVNTYIHDIQYIYVDTYVDLLDGKYSMYYYVYVWLSANKERSR